MTFSFVTRQGKFLLVITFFLSLILALPLCSAISIGVFDDGDYITLYQTCNNCTYCNITAAKYPNTTDFLSNQNMTRDETYYYYEINGTLTTGILGVYKYCYDCGNNVERTTGCIDFEVTYTGEKVSLSNIIIVIVFLILAGVFLVISYSFNKEHWLLKTFFNFCAIGMGILAVNSARIIASESTNLGKMGTTGLTIMITIFSIFFMYMFIYTFIEIIKAFREKRGVRWNF